jgi:hypothetical protein
LIIPDLANAKRLRVAEEINWSEIVPDFGSATRHVDGFILVVMGAIDATPYLDQKTSKMGEFIASATLKYNIFLKWLLP